MNKGKIYLHSHDGDGLGLVPVFQSEGYDVVTHIQDSYFKTLYDGFINKDPDMKHWEASATKNDIVIFDQVQNGIMGDRLRARGVPVVGGQVIADKLEDDRMFGLRIMQQCGVKVPFTVLFKNKQEGLNYVKNNPNRYVHKGVGEDQGSQTTFIAHDAEEMTSYLNNKKGNGEYILQVFVEGLEYSTAIWFSKGKPVSAPIHTIEDKKAYPGNQGLTVGCMSSVEFVDKDYNSKIVKEGIGKCFAWLEKVKFTGEIDLNTIIDKQGNVWGLEWTPRMGYSASYADFELYSGPLGPVFEGIARGDGKYIKLNDKAFGLAIRVGISPYPDGYTKENEKIFKQLVNLTMGKTIKVKPHDNISYYFLDVKKGKQGELITAGNDGIICEICTSDKNIVNGYKRITEAIKDISVDDKWYRLDSFQRALDQIPEVTKKGFYDGPEFTGGSIWDYLKEQK